MDGHILLMEMLIRLVDRLAKIVKIKEARVLKAPLLSER